MNMTVTKHVTTCKNLALGLPIHKYLDFFLVLQRTTLPSKLTENTNTGGKFCE
jgi:hypothetical protein